MSSRREYHNYYYSFLQSEKRNVKQDGGRAQRTRQKRHSIERSARQTKDHAKDDTKYRPKKECI